VHELSAVFLQVICRIMVREMIDVPLKHPEVFTNFGKWLLCVGCFVGVIAVLVKFFI